MSNVAKLHIVRRSSEYIKWAAAPPKSQVYALVIARSVLHYIDLWIMAGFKLFENSVITTLDVV